MIFLLLAAIGTVVQQVAHASWFGGEVDDRADLSTWFLEAVRKLVGNLSDKNVNRELNTIESKPCPVAAISRVPYFM